MNNESIHEILNQVSFIPDDMDRHYSGIACIGEVVVGNVVFKTE